MAGGNSYASKQKTKKIPVQGFTSEFLNSKTDQSPAQETRSQPKKIIAPSLKGILGLGQTVEFNQKTNEVWGQIQNLGKETQILYQNHDQELKKAIDSLKVEIQKLIKSTQNLDLQVEKVALEPAPEPSPYQKSFLERIRQFIKNFRQNIDDAGLWLEAFQTKKKKRNYFWTQANSKKGGSQYLFSSEHSASRSAA